MYFIPKPENLPFTQKWIAVSYAAVALSAPGKE
jgi:hypothetical protein